MAHSSGFITALQFAPNFIAYTRAHLTDAGATDPTSGVEFGQWDGADGTLARALGEFVRRNGLGADRLCLVFPRHETALRILELPSQDPDEIQGMVHLSAEEIVPFPLNELLTAHTILEPLPDGASRVLAVVVRKSLVEAALNVVAAAGLSVDQVLLSTATLRTALRGRQLPTIAAVLHVAPDGFEVAVFRNNTLAFSRGIGQAVVSAPGPITPEALEDIASEVRASFAAYRRDSHDGARADDIIVSASAVDPEPIAASLETALGITARASGDLVARGALDTLAGVVPHHISLMPEAELKRRAAAGTRTRLIRVAAAAAAALVATLAVYGQMTLQRRAYVRQLDQRAEELRPEARTLLAKRQQLRLVEERVDRSMSPLLMLAHFVELAPAEGVNFSRLSFDRGDGIVLNGSATDPKLFDQIIDNIRASGADTFPQFARAREMYRTARSERGRQVWDFAVTIPFDAEGEEGL